MTVESRQTRSNEVRALYAAPSLGTEFTLPLRLNGSPPQNATLRVVEVYVPRPNKPVRGKVIALVELIQIDRKHAASAKYVLKSIVDNQNGESEVPMEVEVCRRVHACIQARNAAVVAGGARWDSTDVVDVFSSRRTHFMLQSVFAGSSLESFAATARSPCILRDVLVRVSEMLRHLQKELHFMHRDFHSANVLVDAGRVLRVCIIDFGMSLIKGADGAYVGNADALLRTAYNNTGVHHNPHYTRACLYRGRASLDLMSLCVHLLPSLYGLSDFASRRVARMCTHAMSTLKPSLKDAFWKHLRKMVWKNGDTVVHWEMCYAHAACTSVRVFEPAVFSHLLLMPQQLYIERPVVGGPAGVGGEIARNNVLNIAEFLKQAPLTCKRFPLAQLAWDDLRKRREFVRVSIQNDTPKGLYDRLAREACALGCSVAVGYLDAPGSQLNETALIVLTQTLPDVPVGPGLYYLLLAPVADAARKYDDPWDHKHGVHARYEFGDLWRGSHPMARTCTWMALEGNLTVAYAAYAMAGIGAPHGGDLRLAPHAKCHEADDDLACLSHVPAGAVAGGKLVNRMLRFVRTNCEGGFTDARADAAKGCYSMNYSLQLGGDSNTPLPITRVARIHGVVGVVCWSMYVHGSGGISATECVFADDYDRLLRITAADTDASLRMEHMILSHQDETDLDAARRSKIEVVYRDSDDRRRIYDAVFRLIYKKDPGASAAVDVVEVDDGEDDDDVIFVRQERWRDPIAVDTTPPPRGQHSRTSWTGAEPTADEAEAEALLYPLVLDASDDDG